MRIVGIMLVTSCMLFAVTAVTPFAEAHHCLTKISVFGRSVLAPAPVPPFSQNLTPAACARPLDEASETHTLPPQTDQIFVRIDGDFGPSIPKVSIELTGLGFERNTFTLNSTESQLGGFTYAMGGWAFVPEPAALDGLQVTAFYPDGAMRVTYESSPIFAPVPPVPVTLSSG
jgi:hypothetical protein